MTIWGGRPWQEMQGVAELGHTCLRSCQLVMLSIYQFKSSYNNFQECKHKRGLHVAKATTGEVPWDSLTTWIAMLWDALCGALSQSWWCWGFRRIGVTMMVISMSWFRCQEQCFCGRPTIPCPCPWESYFRMNNIWIWAHHLLNTWER